MSKQRKKKLNRTRLKALLAECHVPAESKELEFFEGSDANYLLDRVGEELNTIKRCSPEEVERRLVLSIQLLNMTRYKYQELSSGPVQPKKVQTRP